MATVTQEERKERRKLIDQFDKDLKERVNCQNVEDKEQTTLIHYRWHYNDDYQTNYGIPNVANCPNVRLFLFETARKNPGRFFFSIDIQDLKVDPKDLTRPRIGPYAPPVPRRGSWNSSHAIAASRTYKLETFDKRLAEAVAEATKKKNTGTDQIHYRWHFTYMKIPTARQVRNCVYSQPVKDLFTEYLIKYPNQFWVSLDASDLQLRDIDGIQRPIQGSDLPRVEGSNILWSPGSATDPSATASTSTAGTGQTQPKPSPDGGSATKKRKSGSTAPSTVSKPPQESTTADSKDGSGSTQTSQSPTDEPAKKKVKKEDKPQEEKK